LLQRNGLSEKFPQTLDQEERTRSHSQVGPYLRIALFETVESWIHG
jgi:hypothetical protein